MRGFSSIEMARSLRGGFKSREDDSAKKRSAFPRIYSMPPVKFRTFSRLAPQFTKFAHKVVVDENHCQELHRLWIKTTRAWDRIEKYEYVCSRDARSD
jgi:hypothetical protein